MICGKWISVNFVLRIEEWIFFVFDDKLPVELNGYQSASIDYYYE